MRFVIQAHGLSAGVRGPAAAGVGILLPDGAMDVRSRYLGASSANLAAWIALIMALQAALDLHAESVVVTLDNPVVVSQAQGGEKITHYVLQSYAEQAQALVARLGECLIKAVPLEANADAVAAAEAATGSHRKRQPKPPVKVPPTIIPLDGPNSALFPEEVPGPIFAPASDAVAKLLHLSHARLMARDLIALKSGRDAFSGLNMESMSGLLPGHVLQAMKEEFTQPDDVARACRWVMRGLPVDLSIRKVRLDIEHGLNARRARVRGEDSGRPEEKFGLRNRRDPFGGM